MSDNYAKHREIAILAELINTLTQKLNYGAPRVNIIARHQRYTSFDDISASEN